MQIPSVQDLVSKVWSLCNILRDDGITYHQYVNELSYLLFLKMAEETKTEKSLLPGCRWRDLQALAEDPEGQKAQYLHILTELGLKGPSARVKQIFANPTTFIHQPENLNKLISKIDEINWHGITTEGLGDFYEGLLEKNASEKRSGAGQYFTPRPLVKSIVKVTKPQRGELIVDPALGTGGFLVAANSFALQNSGKSRKKPRFFGVELVRDTHRLALMNGVLHKLGGKLELGDTLAEDGVDLPNADVILTNPPFGAKKGAGRAMRSLPFPTTNKQLAFLQLIYTSLTPGGRAGVVLPDNVLFEDGVGREIRYDLMEKCNLHTILRLPTGIFYAQGVSTNVLFFCRGKKDNGNTKRTWIFDLRTNMPNFGKRNPLMDAHFAEFERCFGRKPDGTSKRTDQEKDGRFRSFERGFVSDQGENLDITWLKDEKAATTGSLVEPDEIAAKIRTLLLSAVSEIDELAALLAEEDKGT